MIDRIRKWLERSDIDDRIVAAAGEVGAELAETIRAEVARLAGSGGVSGCECQAGRCRESLEGIAAYIAELRENLAQVDAAAQKQADAVHKANYALMGDVSVLREELAELRKLLEKADTDSDIQSQALSSLLAKTNEGIKDAFERHEEMTALVSAKRLAEVWAKHDPLKDESPLQSKIGSEGPPEPVKKARARRG